MRKLTRVVLAVAAVALGGAALASLAPESSPGAPAIDVLLAGDYPDPTVIREGEYFYMTHTSHVYLPGLLLWRSKDLLNWERVGYALTRPVGDVWAPDLAKFNDRFYIYFPAGNTNWVVTAASPEGPWSDPVDLKIAGIDPGHIASPDGRRYLYQDDGYVVPLAPDGLSVAGERRRVYEGWPYPKDWTVECFCLEAPKLMFVDGIYYLTSAEGGTAGPGTSHMAVLARSKSPLGPWENSPLNPIVHTWSKSERYLSKGHGTIFQDAQGRWFIVYHAYENGHMPLGRQTLLEPLVRTADGWFRTARDPKREGDIRIHRNIVVESDDFSAARLKLQWQFSGLDTLDAAELKDGRLTLACVPDGLRVMHAIPGDRNFEATVRLEPDPEVETGLIVHYDEKNFAGLGVKNGFVFTLARGELAGGPMIEAPQARYFKVRVFEYDLTMLYSDDGREWKTCPGSLEVSGYHHNMLGGFLSLKIGIYGRGQGSLRIDNFTYSPIR